MEYFLAYCPLRTKTYYTVCSSTHAVVRRLIRTQLLLPTVAEPADLREIFDLLLISGSWRQNLGDSWSYRERLDAGNVKSCQKRIHGQTVESSMLHFRTALDRKVTARGKKSTPYACGALL